MAALEVVKESKIKTKCFFGGRATEEMVEFLDIADKTLQHAECIAYKIAFVSWNTHEIQFMFLYLADSRDE